MSADLDDVEGWACLADAIAEIEDDDPRWQAIARVVAAARATQPESAEVAS